jgi:hypothetical protein
MPGIWGSLAGIDIGPAAPAQLVVSGYPIPTVAGVRHRFTVTVEDPYGNLVPSYTGPITLRASDPRAQLRVKRYTLRPSDRGSHSFVAVFKTAGSRTLTARAKDLASVPETDIVVLGAAARKLLVSGLPRSSVAGQS